MSEKLDALKHELGVNDESELHLCCSGLFFELMKKGLHLSKSYLKGVW